MGRASFGAYLVHAPIIVLLAIALRGVPVPAELKFLAVFGLGVVASFGIGWLATRSRVGGRVL
jgi:peptidoglycan/LPS O-acetylase OafA/YrhL